MSNTTRSISAQPRTRLALAGLSLVLLGAVAGCGTTATPGITVDQCTQNGGTWVADPSSPYGYGTCTE